MSEALFVPAPAAPGGAPRFVATELTRGPWSHEYQHGGPSAALLAHGMAALLPAGVRLARVTVEFTRPVPIAELTLRAEIVRAGRAVTTLAAGLTAPDGTEVVRATALAMRTLTPPLELPGAATPAGLAVKQPGDCPPFTLPFFTAPVGYHTAIELRFAGGDFGRGPTQTWIRMRVPLIAGVPIAPLDRVLVAADSGNGVSLVLDVRRYTFVNPDLTVAVWRQPVGEWVSLDARTDAHGDGIGLADTLLSDTTGPFGRGLQTLLVSARP